MRRRLMGLSPLGMAVLGGGARNIAWFTCTTTGAQTLTINSLGQATGKTITVDWGDGTSNQYSGSAASRTHNYASAGAYRVSISPATDITTLDIRDSKVTLSSANIKSAVNITSFIATGLAGGTFNSSDVSAWRPTTYRLYSMSSGYTGTFNSSDISQWRAIDFYVYSMPSGFVGTLNSSDVSAWRPKYFYVLNLPGFSGTFNSSDVSSWRPTIFNLGTMASGYTGAFNSSDVSAWRPTYFGLHTMPASYTITISAGGFGGWTTPTTVDMQSNALSQTKVNQILADLWAAFPARTATGGTINVGGSNAAPSGTYQAANPPDEGKEYAYELVNDSQNINPTKKWSTVTFTA